MICVVDDDESVRLAVGTLLRSVGFEIRAFSSGAEFMLSGVAEECDCLIADIRMAGMSGFELREALMAAGIDLPVVFISAHVDPDAQARVLATGAAGFLSKPFTESALLECVRAALLSRRR